MFIIIIITITSKIIFICHRIFFHTDLTYYDHMPGVLKKQGHLGTWIRSVIWWFGLGVKLILVMGVKHDWPQGPNMLTQRIGDELNGRWVFVVACLLVAWVMCVWWVALICICYLWAQSISTFYAGLIVAKGYQKSSWQNWRKMYCLTWLSFSDNFLALYRAARRRGNFIWGAKVCKTKIAFLQGGETMLVDGFHAAKILRKNHPKMYVLACFPQA